MNAAILPSYATADAAMAVGIEPKQLDAWLSRSAFRLENNDIDAKGHGHPRSWSLRTIRKLGIMVALAKLGLTPAKACAGADLCIKRTEHFSNAFRTFAAFDVAGNVTITVIDRASNFEDHFDNIIGGGVALVIMDLTRLFARIDAKLISIGN